MSRLKKRSVAGGGPVSGAAAATRADCVGGEASPSPARAHMGDTMVSTTTNLNACHICLRPPFHTGLQARTEHGGQYGRNSPHGGERWCQSRTREVNLRFPVVGLDPVLAAPALGSCFLWSSQPGRPEPARLPRARVRRASAAH